MVHAKNYETASKYVKGMPKILWALFFPGHGVDTTRQMNFFFTVGKVLQLVNYPRGRRGSRILECGAVRGIISNGGSHTRYTLIVIVDPDIELTSD